MAEEQWRRQGGSDAAHAAAASFQDNDGPVEIGGGGDHEDGSDDGLSPVELRPADWSSWGVLRQMSAFLFSLNVRGDRESHPNQPQSQQQQQQAQQRTQMRPGQHSLGPRSALAASAAAARMSAASARPSTGSQEESSYVELSDLKPDEDVGSVAVQEAAIVASYTDEPLSPDENPLDVPIQSASPGNSNPNSTDTSVPQSPDSGASSRRSKGKAPSGHRFEGGKVTASSSTSTVSQMDAANDASDTESERRASGHAGAARRLLSLTKTNSFGTTSDMQGSPFQRLRVRTDSESDPQTSTPANSNHRPHKSKSKKSGYLGVTIEPGTDSESNSSPQRRSGLSALGSGVRGRPTTPRKTTLTHLARIGDLKSVQKMLNEGADVNAKSTSGETPLFAACRAGAFEVARSLLQDFQADPSISKVSRHPTSAGLTPLAVAAQNGHTKIVELLLQSDKVDPDVSRADGGTPLILAAFAGHDAVVKLLCDAGATLEQAMEGSGATALLCATTAGHRKTVQQLLDAGASPNHASIKGETPLFIASQLGHVEVVRLLLSAGASVNAARRDGFTALHACCSHGHMPIVKVLIAEGCGAEHTARYGITPIMIACQSGHINVVKHLVLEANASVSQTTVDGRTPLWIACQHGHVDIAKWLHDEADAELNIRMNSLATPLWIAAQNGHTSAVEWLVSAGAVITLPDKDGQTPFFVACQNGFLEVAQCLHKAGASLDQPRLDGATPLSSAAFNGRARVLAWLLKKGADQGSSSSETHPFLLACQQGHLDCVKLLIELGNADLEQTTPKGATAFWIACKNGHYPLARYLLSQPGVDVEATTTDGVTPRGVAELVGHTRIVHLIDEYLAEHKPNGTEPSKVRRVSPWRTRSPTGSHGIPRAYESEITPAPSTDDGGSQNGIEVDTVSQNTLERESSDGGGPIDLDVDVDAGVDLEADAEADVEAYSDADNQPVELAAESDTISMGLTSAGPSAVRMAILNESSVPQSRQISSV